MSQYRYKSNLGRPSTKKKGSSRRSRSYSSSESDQESSYFSDSDRDISECKEQSKLETKTNQQADDSDDQKLCICCKNKIGRGRRLGGKGAREDLAALTRAARKPLRRINKKAAENSVNDKTKIKSDDKQSYNLALLIKLSPFAGSYAPWIDKDLFIEYLRKVFSSSLDELQISFEWSYPRGTHRLVCIKTMLLNGETLINRFKERSKQTVFHLGDKLRLEVLNKETLTNNKKIPFEGMAKQLGVHNYIEKKSEGTLSVDEILQLSLTEMLDIAKDEIVAITKAFKSVQARNKNSKNPNPTIRSSALIYKCLVAILDEETPLSKTMFIRAMKLSNLIKNSLKEPIIADLEDFIRLYLVTNKLKESVSENLDFGIDETKTFTVECENLFKQYSENRRSSVPFSEILDFFQDMGIRDSQSMLARFDSRRTRENGMVWNDIKHLVEELQAFRG